MSIITGKKERGRPPVDSEEVAARLRRDLLDGIDAYAASQAADGQPSRADVIRLALRDWLTEQGFLKVSAPDPEVLAANKGKAR